MKKPVDDMLCLATDCESLLQMEITLETPARAFSMRCLEALGHVSSASACEAFLFKTLPADAMGAFRVLPRTTVQKNLKYSISHKYTNGVQVTKKAV